jgi:hypothetical protein
MKPFSRVGLIALVAIIFLFAAFTQAQEEPVHVIAFDFPTTLAGGSQAYFTFNSTLDLTSGQTVNVAWQNEPGEPSRDTNCLMVQRDPLNTYQQSLQLGLANPAQFCYLPGQTEHWNDDNVGTFLGTNDQNIRNTYNIAQIIQNQLPSNCNNKPNNLFSIRVNNGATIPANTQVKCFFTVADNQFMPGRSNLVRDGTNGVNWVLSKELSLSVTPTRAFVESSRPHPTDPWSFFATVTSSRTGIVQLTTVSTVNPGQERQQFGFDTHSYSAGPGGSFWCYGVDGGNKSKKIARVVPVQNYQMNHHTVNIFFDQANISAECLFRLQPYRQGFQLLDQRVNIRLHQQPLVNVMNITTAHVPFLVEHSLSRVGATGTGDEHEKYRAPGLIAPEVRVFFPIPPQYPTQSIFFARFSPLEGTKITGAEFTSLFTVTINEQNNGNGQNYNTLVTVDDADPSRLKFLYQGGLSPTYQYVGVTLTFNQPAAAPTRYRFQIDILDANGTLLNPSADQRMEIDVGPQIVIDNLNISRPGPKEFVFDTTFHPYSNNAGPGAMVRIVPTTHNWFNGTETCTASRVVGTKDIPVTVRKRKGEIFVTLSQEIEQNEQVKVNCKVTSGYPSFWNVAGQFAFEVGVIPPKFIIPRAFRSSLPPFLVSNASYMTWPGSVRLIGDSGENTPLVYDRVPPTPTPAPYELSEPELFDSLQTTEATNPTSDDPQGWLFYGNGLGFITTVEWPQGATLESHLKPAVERVLAVISTVADEGGDVWFNKLTFDDIYYNYWGPARPEPRHDLQGTFVQTESPHDHSRTAWTFYWSLNGLPVYTAKTWAVWQSYAKAIGLALVTAYDNTIISDLDSQAYVEGGVTYRARGFPAVESCKGVSAFGKPACLHKLPGQSCGAHAECASFTCTDDKVCASLTRYTRYNQLVRPEALAAFTPEKFQYLTSDATSVSFFAAVGVVLCALFF